MIHLDVTGWDLLDGLDPQERARPRFRDQPRRPERPQEIFLAGAGWIRSSPSSGGPFRPQDCGDLVTQGIGLRPRPWAGISRPVGPQRPYVGQSPTGLQILVVVEPAEKDSVLTKGSARQRPAAGSHRGRSSCFSGNAPSRLSGSEERSASGRATTEHIVPDWHLDPWPRTNPRYGTACIVQCRRKSPRKLRPCSSRRKSTVLCNAHRPSCMGSRPDRAHTDPQRPFERTAKLTLRVRRHTASSWQPRFRCGAGSPRLGQPGSICQYSIMRGAL